MGKTKIPSMPAVVSPDLPDDVGLAIEVLGNKVRYAAIRSLMAEGPGTRRELSDRLGVSTSLLQSHLRRLELLAVVSPTPARSEPGRLRRRYVVDQALVRRLAEALSVGLST